MKPAAPALLGTLRRRRRVHADASSTTWEAWDTATGERALLRLFRDDVDAAPLLPFDLRATPGLRVPFALPELATLPLPASIGIGDVPFVRTAAVSCSLADLLPIDGGPGTAWSARLALGALSGLAAVHATGHAHGWVGAESVVATRAGWTLAWLGPVPDATPADDLRALGLLVGAVDPSGAIGELVGGFAEDPPPSAEDAARLVLGTCAGLLARERHAVLARARALGKASRRARLGVLANRLAETCPPPIARGCVRIDAGGVALHVVSDGARVFGIRGLVDAPTAEGFDVWGPHGLDPVGARALLRAWATRSLEDGTAENAPRDVATEAALDPLMRWLAAASRLRVDRRILSGV